MLYKSKSWALFIKLLARPIIPLSDKRASPTIFKQYNKMLKTPKTVAPSALTPFKNNHCDGPTILLGGGLRVRGQGPNMKMAFYEMASGG